MKPLLRNSPLTLRHHAPLLRLILSATILAAAAASCGKSAPVTSVDYPVAGIDVSAHNGTPDFNSLRSQGIEFALIKATEGTDYKDAQFHRNHREATRAGLKTGAYHFFRFNRPGYMQALNLLHSVRGKHLDLPLAIDVEEWTNVATQPTEGIVEQLREMIRHLESHGYRVMLYTNKNGYERFIRGRFESYPVWLCTFSPVKDTHRCVIWQYSHKGELDGVEGAVDLDAFRGTRREWDLWSSGCLITQ